MIDKTERPPAPTLQETFNTVAEHLLTQGHRAETADGLCVYRNDAGDSCAVGCLIPADAYSSDFEGLSLTDLLTTACASELPAYFTPQRELLDRLQSIHDYEPPARWPVVLDTCAVEFNLTPYKELTT